MKIFSAILSIIFFLGIITPLLSENLDIPESDNKENTIKTEEALPDKQIKPEEEYRQDSENLDIPESDNKENTINIEETSPGEEIKPEEEFHQDSEDLDSSELENKENIIKAEETHPGEEIKPEEKSEQENVILGALHGWELNGAVNIPVYADAFGVQVYGGLMTGVGNLIKTDNYTKDIMLGMSFIYSSGWKGETELSGYGMFFSSGYRIFLSRYIENLPWYFNIRFIPHLKIGAFSENIKREGSEWNGTAVYLSPALIADIELPSSDKIRIGLHAGYDVFISDEPVRDINLGVFSSFKF